MNRTIIWLAVFITVILSGVTFYRHHLSWQPFRCNTHAISHIVTLDGRKLELNLNFNVVTPHKGKSELLAVGSLSGLNENYAISRRIFISIQNSDFIGFTKAMITREEHQPIDNIPNDIWQQYVMPEALGVAFYIETKQLNKNLFLVKGLTNPFFVCAVMMN
ncbi:hypothetical protein [Yersinia massiliensis]|uniref:hypothetical protein n=1 Tax=Yersinia massiliensis TaxID=419257 RepID=UPI0011AAD81B|nr:hypothetical protein [Yersinia massiliensis]